MKFLFKNLPDEIINYILLYDDHFIMRNGKLISIFLKTDYRYVVLSHITLKFAFCESYHYSTRYQYYFQNLFDYYGRQRNNSDLIQVTMSESKELIKYKIWIGRQYPKSFPSNNLQNFYVENPVEYHWIYTEYEYERR